MSCGRWPNGSPPIRLQLEAITGPGEDRLLELRRAAPWAAEAFEDFLERYGHRTTSYDPGDPTLFERPDVVIGLLADQTRAIAAGAGEPGESGDALAQARVQLAGRSEDDKQPLPDGTGLRPARRWAPR